MSLGVEHFTTLCCLGLRPEPALMAIAAGLRDLIPSEWTRIALHDQHGTVTSGYAENGAFPALFAARFAQIAAAEPASIAALRIPAMRASGIGWTLHKQNADYLRSAYYNEFEREVDACWLLDAMVHDGTRSILGLMLSRPRSAKPFRDEDVLLLDRVRPWIAHAFRERGDVGDDRDHAPGLSPLHKAMVVANAAGEVLFRSAESEQLFMMLNGTSLQVGKHSGAYAPETPSAVRRVVHDLIEGATSHTGAPPRVSIETAWGLICVEAVWLASHGVTARDVVANHGSVQIGVTIELREYAVPYVARVLRIKGASPGQVRIGVLLATGMTKPAIAKELGIKASSVVDGTRRIYERLEVRNAAELGMKLFTTPKMRTH